MLQTCLGDWNFVADVKTQYWIFLMDSLARFFLTLNIAMDDQLSCTL